MTTSHPAEPDSASADAVDPPLSPMVSPTQTGGVCRRADRAPILNLQGREVTIRGICPRIASIKDEEWIEASSIDDPERFVGELRHSIAGADLFTFAEMLGSSEPRFPKYRVEWDNASVVPLTTFQDWWEGRLPQETRKNVRRSERRGVSVRQVSMDEALVSGIKRIYDETPIRQGRCFWHYGKDLQTVESENSSYLNRSEFFGAYFQDELIGFVKIVYVDKVARIMQILSMNAHFDKRPANALIAKAVERCCQRNMRFFVYGKHVYGNKRNSPVTEFKKRNGFEELRFPRYYVPLTILGKASIGMKLHLGVRDLLPEPLTEFLLKLRVRLYAIAGSAGHSSNGS